MKKPLKIIFSIISVILIFVVFITFYNLETEKFMNLNSVSIYFSETEDYSFNGDLEIIITDAELNIITHETGHVIGNNLIINIKENNLNNHFTNIEIKFNDEIIYQSVAKCIIAFYNSTSIYSCIITGVDKDKVPMLPIFFTNNINVKFYDIQGNLLNE